MKNVTFEEAFLRLEEILKLLNQGKTSLDEAIVLYEEADGLMRFLGKRLNDAEKKIEKLVKTRHGELVLDEEGSPATEEFS